MNRSRLWICEKRSSLLESLPDIGEVHVDPSGGPASPGTLGEHTTTLPPHPPSWMTSSQKYKSKIFSPCASWRNLAVSSRDDPCIMPFFSCFSVLTNGCCKFAFLLRLLARRTDSSCMTSWAWGAVDGILGYLGDSSPILEGHLPRNFATEPASNLKSLAGFHVLLPQLGVLHCLK